MVPLYDLDDLMVPRIVIRTSTFHVEVLSVHCMIARQNIILGALIFYGVTEADN